MSDCSLIKMVLLKHDEVVAMATINHQVVVDNHLVRACCKTSVGNLSSKRLIEYGDTASAKSKIMLEQTAGENHSRLSSSPVFGIVDLNCLLFLIRTLSWIRKTADFVRQSIINHLFAMLGFYSLSRLESRFHLPVPAEFGQLHSSCSLKLLLLLLSQR